MRNIDEIFHDRTCSKILMTYRESVNIFVDFVYFSNILLIEYYRYGKQSSFDF